MITKGSINKYILFRRFITLLFYQNFVCYSFFFQQDGGLVFQCLFLP